MRQCVNNVNVKYGERHLCTMNTQARTRSFCDLHSHKSHNQHLRMVVKTNDFNETLAGNPHTQTYSFFFVMNELMTNIAGICDFGGVFRCMLV